MVGVAIEGGLAAMEVIDASPKSALPPSSRLMSKSMTVDQRTVMCVRLRARRLGF